MVDPLGNRTNTKLFVYLGLGSIFIGSDLKGDAMVDLLRALINGYSETSCMVKICCLFKTYGSEKQAHRGRAGVLQGKLRIGRKLIQVHLLVHGDKEGACKNAVCFVEIFMQETTVIENEK